MKGSNGNNRGLMRAGTKTPPLLLVGLVVTLAIVSFNYWKAIRLNTFLQDELSAIRENYQKSSKQTLEVKQRLDHLTQKFEQQNRDAAREKERYQTLQNDHTQMKGTLEDQIAKIKADLNITREAKDKEEENYRNQIEVLRDDLLEKERLHQNCENGTEEIRVLLLQWIGDHEGLEALQQLETLDIDISGVHATPRPTTTLPPVATVKQQATSLQAQQPAADQSFQQSANKGAMQNQQDGNIQQETSIVNTEKNIGQELAKSSEHELNNNDIISRAEQAPNSYNPEIAPPNQPLVMQQLDPDQHQTATGDSLAVEPSVDQQIAHMDMGEGQQDVQPTDAPVDGSQHGDVANEKETQQEELQDPLGSKAVDEELGRRPVLSEEIDDAEDAQHEHIEQQTQGEGADLSRVAPLPAGNARNNEEDGGGAAFLHEEEQNYSELHIDVEQDEERRDGEDVMGDADEKMVPPAGRDHDDDEGGDLNRGDDNEQEGEATYDDRAGPTRERDRDVVPTGTLQQQQDLQGGNTNEDKDYEVIDRNDIDLKNSAAVQIEETVDRDDNNEDLGANNDLEDEMYDKRGMEEDQLNESLERQNKEYDVILNEAS